MLVRCIYASRSAAKLTPKIIEDILEKSRAKNHLKGITGILCYSEMTFIQVLEGSREEVCKLFNTILRDERHTDVQILVFEEIGVRKFFNWTMGHVDFARLNSGLLLKYHERAVLNPFGTSGQATAALLDELLASAVISTRVR